MIALVVGLLFLLGSHSVRIVADNWRSAQIARLGEGPWKGAITLASFVGLGLIVWGYGMTRQEPLVLWEPPLWTRHLAALLTVPAFILIAAAYIPGTRMKNAVGHPMVLGVKIWAFAHLIANGRLGDLVLFGAILVWAVVDFVSARRRDRAAGTVYRKGPFSRDVIAVVAGLLVWVLFVFVLHRWITGIQPLW